ncbi:MAG: hypothetical protein RIM99_03830 [Cyclobacteriaceae bacterium]
MKLRYSVLIIIGWIVSVSPLHAQSIQEVRKSFHQAVMDPEESRTFHQFLDQTTLNSSTLKAYKAVSEALMARVVWSPFSKLSQVMKYDNLMEMAIEEDQSNIEIRFLRFAIEYNLPRFLGMSQHLIEDRDVIVENMTAVNSMDLDPSFSRYILYFLNDTGLCSQEQISQMREKLADKS